MKSGIVASSMNITVTRKDTMSPMMTSCNVYSSWHKAAKDQNTLDTTSEMALQGNVHSWASFSNGQIEFLEGGAFSRIQKLRCFHLFGNA
jgi:hypothetical protein